MNKKLICTVCAAIAALLLTACEERRTDGDNSETTSLTLTESITENIPEPQPPEPETTQTIELAVFDPFYEQNKLYRDNEALQAEMLETAEKIADARAFLYAEPTEFYQKSKYATSYSDNKNPHVYADIQNPLETNNLDEYSYCPLNTEIAETEDELAQYIRSCFTENFISDEEMTAILFEPDAYGNVPEYKTIDGILCMRQQYMGVGTKLHFDKTSVLSYDGTNAEIAVYGTDSGYPPKMAFMNLVKSKEYGWRLDSLEFKEYDEYEASILYNAVTLREDTLNIILGGGSTPENAETVTIDGESFTQTDLDMTLAEMREYFNDAFQSSTLTKKHIDEVYTEQDGVLFRRDSAPRCYFAQMQLDPFDLDAEHEGNDEDRQLSCIQEFYDRVCGETFTATVRVAYDETLKQNEADGTWEYEHHYMHVISGLPIREYPE
ncbi:MAG: IseA DL-endopeptidase inhibitor family protein [Oscillospiraceae bacterium]|nr:IseA DL-endopeptidase inhibitor family protein [Oscillospiraceae bacterium]